MHHEYESVYEYGSHTFELGCSAFNFFTVKIWNKIQLTVLGVQVSDIAGILKQQNKQAFHKCCFLKPNRIVTYGYDCEYVGDELEIRRN